MKIHGLNKLTLLDYPGRMACLVFTGGCNFRCPYCQNWALVLDPDSQPVIPEEDFFALLKKRKGVLEGVVITGGEPTLNRDLPDFIRRIKAEGYLVKLDTNGTSPAMVESMLKEGLLDYIAMDIKNTREKYALTAGISPDSPLLSRLEETKNLIINSGIDHEFRTTVIAEHHTVEDLIAMGETVRGAKVYYLQPFRDYDTLVGAKTGELHAPSKEFLIAAKQRLEEIVKTEIRGLE